MAALDKFHHAVRTALEKDGWTITDDPLEIEYGKEVVTTMQVDLGAEKVLAARKGLVKIAVEIKSFIGRSNTFEFHLATGQYRNYRRVLRKIEPDREVYLAISQDIYHGYFQNDLVQLALVEDEIKLIVYDAQAEVIVLWKS